MSVPMLALGRDGRTAPCIRDHLTLPAQLFGSLSHIREAVPNAMRRGVESYAIVLNSHPYRAWLVRDHQRYVARL